MAKLRNYPFLLFFLVFSCSQSENPINSQTKTTFVPASPVEKQSVGNCGLYAAAAFGESLLLREGIKTDLSEFYYTHARLRTQLLNLVNFTYPVILPKKAGKLLGVQISELPGLLNSYGLVEEANYDALTPVADEKEAVRRVDQRLQSSDFQLAYAESDRKERIDLLSNLLAKMSS